MVHFFTETRGRNARNAFRGNCAELVRASAFVLATGVCFLLASTPSPAAELAQEKPPSQAESAPPAPSFQQPNSLAGLLAIKPEELDKVDIVLMNLLCADGLRGSENLNVQQCLDTLEAWARHVRRETDRNFHQFAEHPEEFKNALAYYRMGVLGAVLCEDFRFAYNPEAERISKAAMKTHAVEKWNRFFGDSGDFFMHGLLTGKHLGTCSSMPFLYAAIARRLGYPVTIAARKHHLYARYDEGNGEHLNIEATENRGFATPSDDEFRTGWPPMTEDEIRGMGWLRPLSNKEILAICLLNRSSCLRSMGRYEDANAALDLAARYQPETTLAKRVLEKNRKLHLDLVAADRWDALWNEVENLLMPSDGLLAEHFRDRRVGVQFFMNQSTNIAEIEKSVTCLKEELARYLNEISDDSAQLQAAFGPPQPSADERRFLAMLADVPQSGRVLILREQIPLDYWEGIPPELETRVQGMNDPKRIVEEINAYYLETYVRKYGHAPPDETVAKQIAALPPHENEPPHIRNILARDPAFGYKKLNPPIDPKERERWTREQNEATMKEYMQRVNAQKSRIRIVPSSASNETTQHASPAPSPPQNSPLMPSSQSEMNSPVNGEGKP